MAGDHLNYCVIIHRTEDDPDFDPAHQDGTAGFWSEVPALNGLSSAGDTVEECVRMTREAINLFLDVLASRGEAPPPPDAEGPTIINLRVEPTSARTT